MSSHHRRSDRGRRLCGVIGDVEMPVKRRRTPKRRLGGLESVSLAERTAWGISGPILRSDIERSSVRALERAGYVIWPSWQSFFRAVEAARLQLKFSTMLTAHRRIQDIRERRYFVPHVLTIHGALSRSFSDASKTTQKQTTRAVRSVPSRVRRNWKLVGRGEGEGR